MNSNSHEFHEPNGPLLFVLFLHWINFIGALNLLRTRMVEEGKPAFDFNENGVFLVISVAAALAMEIISVILFRAKQFDLKAKYKVLMFINLFLAFVSPFILLMALGDYKENGWTGTLFFNVMLAVVVAYAGYSDESLNKNALAAGCTYVGLVLEPILILLVLFVPVIHNWVVYSVFYSYMVMEVVSIIIVAVSLITELNATQDYKN